MEHKNLTLEYDRNVINKVLDDTDMKYIVLFLYVKIHNRKPLKTIIPFLFTFALVI